MVVLVVAVLALVDHFGSGDDSLGPDDGLAIGLSEANPNLLAAAPGATGPFGASARRLAGLRFTHYRLLVSWAAVQPAADRPPDWDQYQQGCLRALPPCAPYGGVRAQLRALTAREPRPEVLVTLLSTPEWAAAPATGCEDPAAGPRARPPSDSGLVAYRALVRSLLALAVEEKVILKWWSPWNEPNASFFLGPQRVLCDRRSASLTPEFYARMARAMRSELDAAPGDQRLVLGDLSAASQPRPRLTAADEFVAALPRDVACSSDVWALHRYAGDRDVLGAFVTAIDARDCGDEAHVWITETGVGGSRPGQPRATTSAALHSDCRAIDHLLHEFRDDPRVDVAFQYSAREDDQFPVGLLDTALARAYPTLDLWKAWSRRDDGPPPLPTTCR